MSWTLAQGRIRNGLFEAALEGGKGRPDIELMHLEQPLPGLTLTETAPRRWTVSLPIPVEALSDGVQTFVLRDRETGDRLGQFTIVTGVPIEDDLRAEIGLLRAELDLLKKAFRQHIRATGA